MAENSDSVWEILSRSIQYRCGICRIDSIKLDGLVDGWMAKYHNIDSIKLKTNHKLQAPNLRQCFESSICQISLEVSFSFVAFDKAKNIFCWVIAVWGMMNFVCGALNTWMCEYFTIIAVIKKKELNEVELRL